LVGSCLTGLKSFDEGPDPFLESPGGAVLGQGRHLHPELSLEFGSGEAAATLLEVLLHVRMGSIVQLAIEKFGNETKGFLAGDPGRVAHEAFSFP
jgi:hypothetical protein